MKRTLLQLAGQFRHWRRTRRIARDPQFRKERDTAEIIRLVHALEKGLSLENPRLGFGVKKIDALLSRCDVFAAAFGNQEFCLLMAYDALDEYIAFHKAKGYAHADFDRICARFAGLTWGAGHEGKYGGTVAVETENQLAPEQLTAFFASRHSVRDFTGEPISDAELFAAVEAAQLAPSACNRQAVRAYVLSPEKLTQLYGGNMDGIGGFAQDADKFILITGKVSAYRMGEFDQHIVSAGIFTAYLTLALHARGIGSCIVQRPLQYTGQWESIRQACKIPGDEQLVLMMAVGKCKAAYTAPLSKRFPPETVLTILDA